MILVHVNYILFVGIVIFFVIKQMCAYYFCSVCQGFCLFMVVKPCKVDVMYCRKLKKLINDVV